MSCYHPVKAYRTVHGVSFSRLSRDGDEGDIELPCGHCVGCRMRRASDWALRIGHEAQLSADSCFITLTYARDCLPPRGSLDHRDFQLFMKRLRKHRGFPVRFFMCGEYGDENFRPHYHACLFGPGFRKDRIPAGKSGSGELYYESKELSDLWTHGRCSVQDLNAGTAAYCARYVLKKATIRQFKSCYERVDQDTGEIYYLAPEYCAMSLRPGIGAEWFRRFGMSDVFNHDFVVADGVKRRPPKYYDRLFFKEASLRGDEVEYDRELRGRLSVADSSPERLVVREEVHLAKVAKFQRSM